MSGVNAYGVGSDTTLTVISNGVILAPAILTSFNAEQIAARLKSVAIDGVNRYRDIEEGWQGNLTCDRADSTLDDYFAAKEAARYNGQLPPIVTITETTVNVDGSISIYRYDGVTMKFDDIGARKGDDKIDQRVSWAASFRVKVQ
jgi:hypothetical protein